MRYPPSAQLVSHSTEYFHFRSKGNTSTDILRINPIPKAPNFGDNRTGHHDGPPLLHSSSISRPRALIC